MLEIHNKHFEFKLALEEYFYAVEIIRTACSKQLRSKYRIFVTFYFRSLSVTVTARFLLGINH